jgi:hypothetical protein
MPVFLFLAAFADRDGISVSKKNADMASVCCLLAQEIVDVGPLLVNEHGSVDEDVDPLARLVEEGPP